MGISTLISSSAMNFIENRHPATLLEKLWSQREAGRFCDVVLYVQGQKFLAHRNILAACSPFFDSVLNSRKSIKEQLTVTCKNLDSFQLFLNYIYTGAVVIDKNNVDELLRLSNHFLVQSIKNYCAEFLNRHLDVSNCLAVKDMAEKYNLPVLLKNASIFIHNHILEVIKQNEILDFTANKLEGILKENPNISSHVLLNFICKWVERDFEKRENDLKTLFLSVNWDSSEQQHITDCLKSSTFLQNTPKLFYHVLNFLKSKNIDVSEFDNTYSSLKEQYDVEPSNGTEGNVSSMNKASVNESCFDDNIPITVAPLEKESKSNHASEFEMEETTRDYFNESSNSNYDDVAPDNTNDYGDNDDSKSSEEKPHILPNNKTIPPKSKTVSVKNKITYKKSAKNGNASKTPKTVPPIKIKKKLFNRVTKKTFKKVIKKEPNENDTPTESKKNSNKSNNVVTPNIKRYVSETDTDDDDENDDNDGSSSATDDSSNQESFNGYSKSKWKDGVKCIHCSYIAHSAIRLEKHVSRIHAKDVTYKCKVCKFTCKWNREYYLHMKTHFHGPPFRCELCEYTCDRIQFLLSHQMRHTDERPFKCDECDHRCRTKANLDCHMRCHTGEKPYQCEHCERRFAIKASLDQHLASHREDRPFLCDACGFSTKYQSHLFSHKRIHTGDVFHCQFPNCKYSTPKKSQLGSHHRTHTAVRSHICSICGRAFIEKSHLVRHERIHLNEKPFKCEQCDYSSSRRDKLKEHFRKHHGENATAKGPYRPRKQRRQGDAIAYSPSYKPPTELENNQLPPQHMEIQAIVTTIGANNNPPPAHMVYNYEATHQEGVHVATLQPLDAVAHNYQVAFMEQRYHQPHHHSQQQHAHHPHVAGAAPIAVSTMMADQNRINTVQVNTHEAAHTNAVGQPAEFNPFIFI